MQLIIETTDGPRLVSISKRFKSIGPDMDYDTNVRHPGVRYIDVPIWALGDVVLSADFETGRFSSGPPPQSDIDERIATAVDQDMSTPLMQTIAETLISGPGELATFRATLMAKHRTAAGD